MEISNSRLQQLNQKVQLLRKQVLSLKYEELI